MTLVWLMKPKYYGVMKLPSIVILNDNDVYSTTSRSNERLFIKIYFSGQYRGLRMAGQIQKKLKSIANNAKKLNLQEVSLQVALYLKS